MKLADLSLRTKLFGLIAGLLVVMGILLVLFVRPIILSKLKMELVEKGEFMAASLSLPSAEYLLKKEVLKLQVALHEVVTEDNDTFYLYVTDDEGEVVAHTFADGFPVGLAEITHIDIAQERHFRDIKIGEEHVLDVAGPIMEGQLGTVHIGLSERIIHKSASDVVNAIIAIVLAVLLAGIVSAFVFAEKLVGPLKELVKSSEAVGRGDFDRRVTINGEDEVGRLGKAFNRMIEDLRLTTVSKEDYQQQTEFVHEVLAAIPYPFYVINVEDYSIALANPATAALETWQNTTCHKLTHDQDSPCATKNACLCPLDEVQKTGVPVSVEHVHLDQKGNKRIYEVHGYPIFDKDKRLLQMIEYSIDISDRKRAEQNLLDNRKKLKQQNLEIEESRMKLQSALDEISKNIQNVANLGNFTVRFKNESLQKCYQIKRCHNDKCPCFGLEEPRRCWQVAGTFCGKEAQGDFAIKLEDCMACEVYKAATTDTVSKVGEHFNNMMHILESKNNELEQAYVELQSTHAQMMQQEKMASVGQLAAGVAHEINNPMGFITSNLGTLRKYSDRITEFMETVGKAVNQGQSEDQQDFIKQKRKEYKIDYILEDIGDLVEESLDGAKRVTEIVKNLKSFARLDDQGFRLADIQECIESTLKIIWNELKYKAEVIKDYSALPKTSCLPSELNQVFMNIMVNAAQAIEERGEITIKTRHESNTIYISFTDTGCGIPEDKLGKIFEPFYTSKEPGKGTGLGMSISYDIIRKHEGEITIDSEVGKGTTFTIELPVKDEQTTA